MEQKKVVQIVLDILESCDCEDERICNKCPFVNLCAGIFTGDWSNVPNMEEEEEEND